MAGGRSLAAACVGLALAGCAGAVPVLTPARVLRSGEVAVDLGGGYVAPASEPFLVAAHDAQQRAASAGGEATPDDRAALERAAGLWAASPPGLASYGSVRVGAPSQTELQASVLGGRTLRLGARRQLWGEGAPWAFSLGFALRGAAYPALDPGVVRGLSLEAARALGADVTAVLGRTSSGLYDPYLALRASYTHGYARAAHPSVRGGAAFDAALHQGELGLTVGMRVGFGRVSAAAECGVSVGYAAVRAGETDAGALTVQVLPAAALTLGF